MLRAFLRWGFGGVRHFSLQALRLITVTSSIYIPLNTSTLLYK